MILLEQTNNVKKEYGFYLPAFINLKCFIVNSHLELDGSRCKDDFAL